MADDASPSELMERIARLQDDDTALQATLEELEAVVTAQERADAEKQARLLEQWYARIAHALDVDTEELVAIAERARAHDPSRQDWERLRAYLEAAAAEELTRQSSEWSAAFRQVHAQTFCRILAKQLDPDGAGGEYSRAVHDAWRSACWAALWYTDHAH